LTPSPTRFRNWDWIELGHSKEANCICRVLRTLHTAPAGRSIRSSFIKTVLYLESSFDWLIHSFFETILCVVPSFIVRLGFLNLTLLLTMSFVYSVWDYLNQLNFLYIDNYSGIPKLIFWLGTRRLDQNQQSFRVVYPSFFLSQCMYIILTLLSSRVFGILCGGISLYYC